MQHQCSAASENITSCSGEYGPTKPKGTTRIQKGPPFLMTHQNGPVPTPRKEHIANIEQIVYSAVLALPGRGRFVAGLPNPGHKEHGTWVQVQRFVSLKDRPWTKRKPLMRRSPRSSAALARARSCGSARKTRR